MLTRTTIDQIRSHLPAAIDEFVCSASFEERSVSIGTALADAVRAARIVVTMPRSELVSENMAKLYRAFPTAPTEVQLESDSAIGMADALRESLLGPITAAQNTVIDVTTFTHEQLLMLVGLLQRFKPPGNVFLAYLGAEEYSWNTPQEGMWLSRGVREVRTVVGFPGLSVPTNSLHLVVLVGFESERAENLITRLEPAKLSLGVGDAQDSVSFKHSERNKAFWRKVKAFVERQLRFQGAVDEFTFSCNDPCKARDAVLAQVGKYPSFNTVLSPMNTKMSTVGVALAATANTSIQLAYSRAHEYNIEGYSRPGTSVTIFKVEECPVPEFAPAV